MDIKIENEINSIFEKYLKHHSLLRETYEDIYANLKLKKHFEKR